MLEAINLGCVRGRRRLFSDLNFTLKPGMCIQVQGPNGSGKTSLLRILCGLVAPAEGEVRWDGANIRSLGEDYHSVFTYIGHRNGVKDELTALENLRIASGLSGIEVSKEEAAAVLESMGLGGGPQALPTRFLSQGQRRRLALSRLAVSQSSLWILDEVLTSLDRAAVALVESTIAEHLNQGGMAIIATHQQLDLSAISMQRIELANESLQTGCLRSLEL